MQSFSHYTDVTESIIITAMACIDIDIDVMMWCNHIIHFMQLYYPNNNLIYHIYYI